MLTDNGELLFEADEMDFIAIRLEPARPPTRLPTLLTGGSVGERNGGKVGASLVKAGREPCEL